MVTGASTGIGLKISRTLAMHGFNVAMTARSTKKLKHIITDPAFQNVNVIPIELELLSEESIREAFQMATSKFGRVNVLVNNAATPLVKPAVDVTWNDWDTVVNANLKRFLFFKLSVCKMLY